jgi:hypothetical protein
MAILGAVRDHLERVESNAEVTVVKRLGVFVMNWLGRRDSNPNNHVQSVVSYR